MGLLLQSVSRVRSVYLFPIYPRRNENEVSEILLLLLSLFPMQALLRGFLLGLYRIALGNQDFPSPPQLRYLSQGT